MDVKTRTANLSTLALLAAFFVYDSIPFGEELVGLTGVEPLHVLPLDNAVDEPFHIVELGVAFEVKSGPVTTCVIVTLPVMVLVPEGVLPVPVLLLLPEAFEPPFAVVETVETVVQVEAGVETVVLQDEVMG